MTGLASVIIPTYNAAPFIARTMQSVYEQTILPLELVVVDDRSTDGTVDVVRSAAGSAPLPVRLISLNRNSGGPALPLNVGIEAATGDIIALLDHDDLMLPENLSTKLPVLESHPQIEQVFADYAFFWEDGLQQDMDARHLAPLHHALLQTTNQSPWIVPAGVAATAFAGTSVLPGGCGNMCFRKSLWRRIGGFEPRTGPCSDYDFNLRSLEKPVAWVDRKLYRKRLHGGNLWKPTPFNLFQTIRAQWQCLARFPHVHDLRSQVAANTRQFSCRMRWEHQYRMSFGAAARLVSMRRPGEGFAEILKTLAMIPGRAVGRWAR